MKKGKKIKVRLMPEINIHNMVTEVENSRKTQGKIIGCKKCGHAYKVRGWNFYNLCDICFR